MLHRKIDRALVAAGMASYQRAFVPHITTARLARGDGKHPAIARWLADYASLASLAFTPDRLILYESTLGRDGAQYEARTVWPLPV